MNVGVMCLPPATLANGLVYRASVSQSWGVPRSATAASTASLLEMQIPGHRPRPQNQKLWGWPSDGPVFAQLHR